MLQVVKMLLALLIVFLISGCSDSAEPLKTDQYVLVEQRCTIVVQDQPSVDYRKFKEGQEVEMVQWLWSEVLKFKEDGEKVRAEIKKCQ